ncbi:TonB-dependent receptor plug domain-containing protein [Dyadobacter tibetensis]|uniref:TonB-dependent receptor plug domain-containing protein n=1 Tax=Dyadobacter tibetensis TaxID=1211851 RepID=UPI0004704006|nr:TonB-dependent receptor [Dyadobacter tibetensis]
MKIVILLILFFWIPPALRAQDSDSLRTELLKQVNITANRHTESSLSTIGSVGIIKNLSNSSQPGSTTPDVLMGTTGVFMQKTTQGGGSPFIRGLTGNQTLTLIDGIRLNNSTFRYGPNQYLNTVDPFSLDRIEIYRGGGSVAYGTDALGGTIQLFTPTLAYASKTQAYGKVLARYGTSDMEKSIRVQGGIQRERLALQAGISVKKFGDVVGGDTTGRQTPSGYTDIDFDLKGKLKISENWNVILAHQSVNQRHVPVFYRYQLDQYALNEFDPQKRSLSYARLEGSTTKNLWSKITFITSYQTSQEGRNSQKIGENSLRKESDGIKTWGSSLNFQSQLGKNWTASSGVEVYYDKINSKRIDINQAEGSEISKRGLYPDGSAYLNYALYTLHQYRLNRWKVDYGLRYNGFHIKLNDRDLGTIKISPKAFVGNIGLAYQPSSFSNIYLSLNTGFRAPNIDDMGTLGIVDFRYELPAYDLRPERSYNFEMGYKIRSGSWAMGLALFQNYLNDLITREKVPGEQINGVDVYIKSNTEKAQIRGAEFEAEYHLTEYWRIYTSATYSYGKSVSNQEPLRRIPPVNGRVGLSFHRNQLTLTPEMLWAGAQKRLSAGDKSDNRIPEGGTPAWSIFNIRALYDWKILSLQVQAHNLFNADYRTHGSGINGPGRSLWIGLTANF